MENTLTEQQVKTEFKKIIAKRGFAQELGLTKHDAHNLRNPERQTMRAMLYILYRSKKLKLNEPD